jgi:hypothetical protein
MSEDGAVDYSRTLAYSGSAQKQMILLTEIEVSLLEDKTARASDAN